LTVGELVFEHETRVVDPFGTTYVASSWGAEQSDGPWVDWLEFRPLEPAKAVRSAGRASTQADRKALRDWATGLEPHYIEGTFARAHRRRGPLLLGARQSRLPEAPRPPGPQRTARLGANRAPRRPLNRRPRMPGRHEGRYAAGLSRRYSMSWSR